MFSFLTSCGVTLLLCGFPHFQSASGLHFLRIPPQWGLLSVLDLVLFWEVVRASFMRPLPPRFGLFLLSLLFFCAFSSCLATFLRPLRQPREIAFQVNLCLTSPLFWGDFSISWLPPRFQLLFFPLPFFSPACGLFPSGPSPLLVSVFNHYWTPAFLNRTRHTPFFLLPPLLAFSFHFVFTPMSTSALLSCRVLSYNFCSC